MKLVINIPKETYEALVINQYCGSKSNLENIIVNGTPFPEHHGRLIDADKLRETMEKDPRKALSFVDLTDFVWLAPTIIEADKESEE